MVLCDTMGDIMQPEHISRSLEGTKHIIISCNNSQSCLQLAACFFMGIVGQSMSNIPLGIVIVYMLAPREYSVDMVTLLTM